MPTDAREAIEAFFIENHGWRPNRAERIWAGNNLVYFVEFAERRRAALKIFRASNAPDEARLAALARWSAFLKSRGIDAPLPLLNFKGFFLSSIHFGGRTSSATAFSWIDGELVERPDADFARSFGAATAEMHLASEVFSAQNRDFPTTRLDALFVEKLARELLDAAVKAGFSEAIVEKRMSELAFEIESIGQGRADFGLIHTDLNLKNVVRKKDGSLALIDWAEIAWGPFALDLAVAGIEMAPFSAPSGSLQKSFEAGYRAVRALPLDWPQQLRTAEKLVAALYASWFFDAKNAVARARPSLRNFGKASLERLLD